MELSNIWRWTFFTRLATKSFDWATEYTPPILTKALKHFSSEWKYQPQGWPAEKPQVTGWNDQSVADVQEKHWPMLVQNLQGPGPLGVSHFPWSTTRENRADHNAMMSYGYVLALATRQKDSLSLLDWGGGAGHYYLYAKALVPEIAIQYHCYEVPSLCRLGRKLLPEVKFYDDVKSALETQYDLVVSSSSLHYFQDWREVVRMLAGATREFLYVARLQTVRNASSFVVVQRPYRAGYYTAYPGWFLNRQEFLSTAIGCGLELVREFVFTEQWYVRNAPEQGDCRGFLFRRRSTRSDAYAETSNE